MKNGSKDPGAQRGVRPAVVLVAVLVVALAGAALLFTLRDTRETGSTAEAVAERTQTDATAPAGQTPDAGTGAAAAPARPVSLASPRLASRKAGRRRGELPELPDLPASQRGDPDVTYPELSQTAAEAFRRAQEAEKQGDRAAALELYREAAELDPDNAMPLLAGGRVARAMGDLISAEQLFEQAAERVERVFGSDDPRLARALSELGSVYVQERRYDVAEETYRRALSIAEGSGYRGTQVAGALGDLGFLYRMQGRYEEARSYFELALAVQQDASGRDHPNVAARLSSLGMLHYEMGSYEEAATWLEQAVSLREQAQGPNNPQTISALRSLARAYDSLGRYGDAEPLLERVVQASEALYGPDHPSLATDLSSLGAVYLSEGRFRNAEPLYLRALEIQQARGGSAVPDASRALDRLAINTWRAGRPEDAEAIYQWAIELPPNAGSQYMRDQYAAYLRAAGRDAEAAAVSDG